LSTDVQELDAASHNSVDNVRELIEAIRYAPSPGKHRIYVVDEVHMLSTPAFNALLKTLEEPPPQSIFIFATTNPEKIPITVLSRCQRYDLRRIPTVEIAQRLADVAKGEGISISHKSLLAIAKEGDGSLRDAMTLLDQILAYGSEEIDDEQVARVLDLTDRNLLLAIAKACVDADAVGVLEACANAAATGIEPKRLGAELLQMFRDLTVVTLAPQSPNLVEGSDAEIAELREIAARTDATRLRRMFRALFLEQEGLTWAPQPFAVLEMAAVRLATMTPTDDVNRLLTRLEGLARQPGHWQPPTPSPTPPRGGGGGGPRESIPAPSPASVNSSEPAKPALREARRPDPKPSAASSAPTGAVLDRLRSMAKKSNRVLFLPLDDAEILENVPGLLRLELPESFGASRLAQRKQELEDICESFFGCPTRVEIESRRVGTTDVPEQPDLERQKRSQDLVRKWKQNALEHPAINQAIEILGAEVVSIRTLEGKQL